MSPGTSGVPSGGASSGDLKGQIRAAALAAGFDRVGFAPAEPPLHGAEYEAWLAHGHHGEMAYLAREDAVRRRLDPREALPGCRTLIVVTLHYGSPAAAPASATAGSHRHLPVAAASSRRRPARSGAAQTSKAPPPELRALNPGRGENAPAEPRPAELPRPAEPIVAGYAVGRDYHDVFEEGLDKLAAAVTRLAPGAQTKRYVDYGPVLERDHAQRAGLGWIGKNTMLIHPDRGSWFMLGELLTDVEIEPDPPFVHDRCGTCRRCIDACPTDAILGGRVLDARLCISYLTIELKGAIPEALRPAIGNRVFGCDICQEVCPWNSDIPQRTPGPFAPRAGQPMPPDDMAAWAEEIAALDEEGFRARYRGTAFRRPGRAGMLRNLAVGLGNEGGPAARPVLERLAADDSELVREHARWALARLDPSPSP